MAKGPGIPKGTRDFSPAEMLRRNYIFDTIRSVFRLYGYQPLETPAMENLSTLLGKYGEEGDRLLFKILNSGDFKAKLSGDEWTASDSSALSARISEKGLRYDLTVPFARYVVTHLNDISFPFKRYQIQPVWRADKPQKGRYREFYQCDVDVIGDNSLYNEYELIRIIDDVFRKLSVKTVIKVNNRKILNGIAEKVGARDRITDITVAIDKLDKIGLENVNKELSQKGLSGETIKKLQPILFLKGSSGTKLDELEKVIGGTESGLMGINEMKSLFAYLNNDSLTSEVVLMLTLARGLDYYTGTIIEVEAVDSGIGSICGGGRYDDLTGIFGLKDVSGVGVSFGADRIYDVMNSMGLFKQDTGYDTRVLLVNFGEQEEKYSIDILKQLRQEGIASELYPSPVKIKKQMSYANNRNIPWVIMAGENEVKDGTATVKNMETGKQEIIERNNIISFLKKEINR